MPESRPDTTRLSLKTRFRGYWESHRALFWTLHSIWAFACGAIVVFLAHERYGFVPWILLFLVLTWTSTLLFNTTMAGKRPLEAGRPPGFRSEVASYLTRIMYQETLFFVIPFYWYSTVVGSPNVFFLAVLVGLGILSCIDLLFDRWLRHRYFFGLAFFAIVTFAACNLVIPILVPLEPALSTPVAAAVAAGSSIPLAGRAGLKSWSGKAGTGLLVASFLILAIGVPQLVPPVPLRLNSATFSSGVDRSTLEPADTLGPNVEAARLVNGLFVIGEVFSPANLSTTVSVQWKRNGAVVRTSREIDIVAHELGFRVWDRYPPEAGGINAGSYEVVLRAAGNRVFGRAEISVTAD